MQLAFPGDIDIDSNTNTTTLRSQQLASFFLDGSGGHNRAGLFGSSPAEKNQTRLGDDVCVFLRCYDVNSDQ